MHVARQEVAGKNANRGLRLGLQARLPNGIARARVLLASALDLDVPADGFDVMVGRLVLHHSGVAAAVEIRRLLRSGGIAAFEESASRNPVLMAVRGGGRLARGLGWGSADPQNPMTEGEVRDSHRVFDGHAGRGFPGLVLFGTLARTLLRGRFARTSRFLNAVDHRPSRSLPALKRFGFSQALWMRKP